MTLAALRTLHATIGAALDDIERVYRPPPSSRRPSHSSTSSSVRSGTRTHMSFESDVDNDPDADDADVSEPPTPVGQSPVSQNASPGVRFAPPRRGRGGMRVRAQTLTHIPSCPSVGSLPAPILKQPPLDFPSLDTPVVPACASRVGTEDGIGETPRQKEWKKKCEDLTSNPEVVAAVTRIVAACGQMAASVQKPFLTLCDAAMGYHLPACLRFLEASHTVEILRETGTKGMHVDEIAKRISSAPSQFSEGEKGVDPSKLSHVLRLLATHHITREVRPNVFANNRVSSAMDSGKAWKDIVAFDEPEKKYEDTDGFAAFVGLCTDEIFKASAYLTDTYLMPSFPLSTSQSAPVLDSQATKHEQESSLPSPPTSASASPPLSPRAVSSLSPLNEVGRAHETLPSAYGMYTPNDSTVSLPERSDLPHHVAYVGSRNGGSERDTESLSIVFAENPSPNQRRLPPDTERQDSSPGHSTLRGVPVPATPSAAQRVALWAQGKTGRGPPLVQRPPISASGRSTPTPGTPRSPLGMSSAGPETPRSTPYAVSNESAVHAISPNLTTPRTPSLRSLRGASSSGSGSGTSSIGGRVKKKASFSSFMGMGKRAAALGFGSGTRDSGGNAYGNLNALPSTTEQQLAQQEEGESPPTPRSPVVTRRKMGQSQSVQGYFDTVYAPGRSAGPPQLPPIITDAYDPARGNSDGEGVGEGLLGPAFDPPVRPPTLAPSRTFPGHATPGDAASPLLPRAPAPTPVVQQAPAPPRPPKSALRQMSSPGILRSPRALAHAQRAHGHGHRQRGSKSGSTSSVPLNALPPAPAKPRPRGVQRGDEMYAPFNIAFDTRLRYFEWLEREGNQFRLKRFGKAMTGTSGWEAPGAVIGGFPWQELLPKSVIVDVGGGIGSTSMLLANAFPDLRFVIQDRPPVVEMGIAAWRTRHPEILDTGRAVFQAHDFFKPQPPYPEELDTNRGHVAAGGSSSVPGAGVQDVATPPSVFLLRVITHDWPDSYVTRILLRLRQAAGSHTRLLLADYVLPLACVDEDEDAEPETPQEEEEFGKKSTREVLPGTVRTLAPEGSPLLPNLGKANANAYWLDLTMRVMFNSQERTLRELVALALTAGWKVTQVTRTPGSLFGHIIAVPVDIPTEALALAEREDAAELASLRGHEEAEALLSPPLGGAFLANTHLPSEDTVRAGVARSKLRPGVKDDSDTEDEAGPARRRRERAYTFTGTTRRNVAGGGAGVGKSSGDANLRKGWKSLVKMLSKPQLRQGKGREGAMPIPGMRRDAEEDPYALSRQWSKG